MASVRKPLGQATPNATTEADLYTVPGATDAVISSFVVCNRGAATTFRMSISVAGAATANKDYIYYDLTIAANDTFVVSAGFTMAATDKMRVYAGTTNLSFSLFGQENS